MTRAEVPTAVRQSHVGGAVPWQKMVDLAWILAACSAQKVLERPV